MKEFFSKAIKAGRNPFLSRAGFDPEDLGDENSCFRGRNPFLSRAGFDYFL